MPSLHDRNIPESQILTPPPIVLNPQLLNFFDGISKRTKTVDKVITANRVTKFDLQPINDCIDPINDFNTTDVPVNKVTLPEAFIGKLISETRGPNKRMTREMLEQSLLSDDIKLIEITKADISQEVWYIIAEYCTTIFSEFKQYPLDFATIAVRKTIEAILNEDTITLMYMHAKGGFLVWWTLQWDYFWGLYQIEAGKGLWMAKKLQRELMWMKKESPIIAASLLENIDGGCWHIRNGAISKGLKEEKEWGDNKFLHLEWNRNSESYFKKITDEKFLLFEWQGNDLIKRFVLKVQKNDLLNILKIAFSQGYSWTKIVNTWIDEVVIWLEKIGQD